MFNVDLDYILKHRRNTLIRCLSHDTLEKLEKIKMHFVVPNSNCFDRLKEVKNADRIDFNQCISIISANHLEQKKMFLRMIACVKMNMCEDENRLICKNVIDMFAKFDIHPKTDVSDHCQPKFDLTFFVPVGMSQRTKKGHICLSYNKNQICFKQNKEAVYNTVILSNILLNWTRIFLRNMPKVKENMYQLHFRQVQALSPRSARLHTNL